MGLYENPDLSPVGETDYPENIEDRRRIGDLAIHKVDFYEQAMAGVRDILEESGVVLGPEDIVLDVGTSGGEGFARGAQSTGVEASLVGLDPLPGGHARLHDLDKRTTIPGLHLIKGDGEAIPLPTDSVAATISLKTLFRIVALPHAIREMMRVTKPGGVIGFTTNFKDHAQRRYGFSGEVFDIYNDRYGYQREPWPVPADGFYFEDLEAKFADVPWLTPLPERTVEQHTLAVVTRSSLHKPYLKVIRESMTEVGVRGRHRRHTWRKAVHDHVRPQILDEIKNFGVYTDTIHTGLVFFRNDKDLDPLAPLLNYDLARALAELGE